MDDIVFAPGIFAVEVAVRSEKFTDRNRPRALVLLALAPPLNARSKLFKLDWLSLGVVLPPLWEGVLVVPDILGRSGPVEEQQVGDDRRVRREDAAWKPHNRVEAKLLQQFLLDAR